ncbi:MAG: hypothetical protein PCFJNLEI_01418 [Verrucomicrobiae bacterium]|nr:hypothetical protein [Verrucomicrobiae bacterium]
MHTESNTNDQTVPQPDDEDTVEQANMSPSNQSESSTGVGTTDQPELSPDDVDPKPKRKRNMLWHSGYPLNVPDDLLPLDLRVNGKVLTLVETRKHFAALRARGYRWLPECDNIDEHGRCRGHPFTLTGQVVLAINDDPCGAGAAADSQAEIPSGGKGRQLKEGA